MHGYVPELSSLACGRDGTVLVLYVVKWNKCASDVGRHYWLLQEAVLVCAWNRGFLGLLQCL